MKKYLAGLYARYVIGRENKYFAAPVASQSDMLAEDWVVVEPAPDADEAEESD